jgi:hypothetical protein
MEQERKNIFTSLKHKIGFSIVSYINEHLALMLPYLLHKTNASSRLLYAFAESGKKLFIRVDDDLINLCVRCETSVCSFIIRDGRSEDKRGDDVGVEGWEEFCVHVICILFQNVVLLVKKP